LLQEPVIRLQRACGVARVALSIRGGRIRLDRLHQAGSAKAFLPVVHGLADPVPEVVFLNTSGGLTGGDRLTFALTLGPGARAVATTQTAERAYASAAGRAEVEVALRVGAGGMAHWLPQETILFEASALRRRTVIDLEGDARALVAEMIVFGRVASGEVVGRLTLSDTRLVRRDGKAVLLESLALDGELLRQQSPTLLADARAIATVALVAPGAEDAVAQARQALTVVGVEAAASGWGGKCVVRMMGREPAAVRLQAARVVEALGRRPLPRIWQM